MEIIMMVNVGFGNVVNTDKIIAVIAADSAPSKRMIQKAREENRVIDATQGRKTQSILISDSNHIILSAFLPETILGRLENRDKIFVEE